MDGNGKPRTLAAAPVVEPLHRNGEGSDEDGRAAEGALLPKDGACLLSVGVAQSGKSTLQRALIHRLFTDETVQLEFRDGDGNPIQDAELQDWIFQFHRGEFPLRTPAIMKTFFIEFGRGRRLARLSFAEITGELFQRVLPHDGSREKGEGLGQQLEQIISTPDVKKLFLFVADATRDGAEADGAKEDEKQALFEDMMFFGILNEVRKLGVRRIKILFVATKWDAVTRRNQSARQFFQRRLPQTRSVLRQFAKADVQYMRFSVGDVRTRTVDGETVEVIAKHQPVYAARVLNWIHAGIAGRPLKGYPPVQRTLWDWIKEWVAS